MDAVLDDLFSPEAVANPHPLFAALRAEDPVHWNPRHRAWVLTRHDDVVAGFRDPRLSADRIVPFYERHGEAGEAELTDPVNRLLGGWMVFKDPPDHTRLRRLVSQAFTPRAVRRLEPRIHALVATLLDELAARAAGGDGVVDVRSALAAPLPAMVIAEMLGVPASDHDRFAAWSDDIIALVFGAQGVPDRRARAERGLLELAGYFSDLIEARRARPADDLVGALIAAHDEGEALSADELLSTCTLLLFAGHETTTSLLTNGLAALLGAPDQLGRLRADPILLPTAVEELLRFEGPAKVEVRYAAEPVELRGRRIEPGSRVFLAAIAANRDPERFADPDRLDVARSPNPHLGFGYGLHFCLGAPLARLEATVALGAVLRRFPALAPAADLGALPWHPTLVSRSLAALPVRLGPG